LPAENEAEGAQAAFQFLDVQIIGVAERAVHIETDSADAGDVQGQENLFRFTIGFYTTSRAYNTAMASRIVHLRIAEKLLGFIPDLEPDRFAVGNVAPDSGIPDENMSNCGLRIN